jgi:hypothetical protein
LDDNNTLNVSRAALGGVRGLAVLRGSNNMLGYSRTLGGNNPLRICSVSKSGRPPVG